MIRSYRFRALTIATACAAFAGLAVAVAALPGAQAAPAPVIRIGGPSAPSAPKIAVLGSQSDLAGTAFKVLDGAGHVVLRGTLGRAAGNPAPFAFAETADLSAIHTVGNYRVVVGASTSRPWLVRTHGTRAWVDVMLDLFRANADGRESSPYHGPSHLNDLRARVVNGPATGRVFNLRGGWMDAGDQVKMTSAIAFSVLLLAEAARFDAADRPHIRAMVDVGVRWLLRAHPAPGVFIGQVGDGNIDHNTLAGPQDHARSGVSPIFRRPELDDTRTVDINGNPVSARIRHRVAHATTDASTAGKAAAALAVAARTSSQRATLLRAAADWYRLAKNHINDERVASSNLIYSGDPHAVDDVGTAAAALYETTGEAHYLTDALFYLPKSAEGAGPDLFSTDPYGEAELCNALGGRLPPGSRSNPSTALGKACALLATAAQIARDRGRANAFGSPGEFIWGHTCRAAGNAAIALLGGRAHAGITPAVGLRVAARSRDYLFRLNPWGRRFLGGSSPGIVNVYHWAQTRHAARPLGALVGGPAAPDQWAGSGINAPNGPLDSAQAAYADRMTDYVNNEPSIACQATGVLLLAMLDG